MQINENLGNNAYRKIAKILTKASDLGMDLSGHGEASENTTSGHVYLYLEDYNFTLFIPFCSDEIFALWTNSDDGEEEDIAIDGMPLFDIESWADDLSISRYSEE
jgi:hypothetical protein